MFTSVGSGGSIGYTVPSSGDAVPSINNTLTVTSGDQTVAIQYETTDGPGNPQNVLSGSNTAYGFFDVMYSGVTGIVTIPAFTFNLKITDITDSSVLNFTGTSSGGQIGFNSGSGIDTVNISYSPSPQTAGSSTFYVFSPTSLVIPAPTATFGLTTIQGQVFSTSTPEPASMFLMGAGLLGLGFASRRKLRGK